VESAHTRSHDGTGLGLPITRSLAEMHGGSMTIESEVGKGTTITVRFPAERVGLEERYRAEDDRQSA
jgi:signal transduction histidine kinase